MAVDGWISISISDRSSTYAMNLEYMYLLSADPCILACPCLHFAFPFLYLPVLVYLVKSVESFNCLISPTRPTRLANIVSIALCTHLYSLHERWQERWQVNRHWALQGISVADSSYYRLYSSSAQLGLKTRRTRTGCVLLYACRADTASRMA